MSPIGLPTVKLPDPATVDLSKVYDVLVVGSGAAGGMAAHVLTSHGLDVLLLEAGRQVDFEAEVNSMEWPYHHPRRGKLAPDTYVLNEADYKRLKPPYAQTLGRYTNVASWQQLGEGPDYTKQFFVNEKEHPYTGTNFSWVRSRVLGGRTNVWGRLSLRLSDYDFKAASRDGYGVDWPISYADVAPYYDKVDRYLGISGVTENLPWLPDSIYQRPMRLNPAEVHMRGVLGEKKGWVVTPFRLGVTTEGLSHNKYRSRCFGRGACFRRVGGCDIHAAFDSPTGLIYPAWDTGHLTVRTNATVHQVLDRREYRQGVGRGLHRHRDRGSPTTPRPRSWCSPPPRSNRRASCCSRDRASIPNGLGNSSGHLGRNLCEHVLGPRVHGIYKDRIGAERSNEDGRPGGFYIPRFRNLDEKSKAKDFIRGYGLEGSSGQEMFPEDAMKLAGYGQAYKRKVRDHAGAFLYMYGLGEVLPRYENRVELDPHVKDAWGIPVLRFSYKYGDNEKKMCADMVTSMQEAFAASGFEVTRVDRDPLTEGSSVHELGTARMGTDPKTSVLNPFLQSARCEEPVRGGRRGLRLGRLPEPDLDHHGAVLAQLRLPRRRAQRGEL